MENVARPFTVVSAGGVEEAGQPGLELASVSNSSGWWGVGLSLVVRQLPWGD